MAGHVKNPEVLTRWPGGIPPALSPFSSAGRVRPVRVSEKED